MKRIAFGLLAVIAACSLLPIARAASGGGYGALGAANAAVQASLQQQATCTTTFQAGGSLSGTVTFEASNDGGVTWNKVTSYPDSGSGANGTQTTTSFNGTSYTSPVAGYGLFQAIVTTYSSGTSNAVVACSNGPSTLPLSGGGGGGATPIPTPAGGIYPVTVVAPTDASGNVKTNVEAFSTTAPVSVVSQPPPVQPSPIYTQPVTTPAPAITSSPTNGIAVTLTCPSTEPGAVNSGYACTNTSTGALNVTGTVTTQATASPPAAGFPLSTNNLPSLGQILCFNASAAATSTTTNSVQVGCGGGSHGASLSVTLCNGAAFDSTAACAGVAGAANDSVTSATKGQYGINFNMGYNGTSWDRARTAPSPAPTGIPANSWNSGGAYAPVGCTTGANASTSGTTAVTVIAGSSGKQIFVCSFTLTTFEATTAGNYTLTIEYSANSACTSANTTIAQYGVSAATLAGTTGFALSSNPSFGLALPIIPAADYLCIVASSADVGGYINVMYTQI